MAARADLRCLQGDTTSEAGPKAAVAATAPPSGVPSQVVAVAEAISTLHGHDCSCALWVRSDPHGHGCSCGCGRIRMAVTLDADLITHFNVHQDY